MLGCKHQIKIKIVLAFGATFGKNPTMANNLPTEKKTLAISMLAEGSSIRSTERVTGVHRDTIMRLALRVGEASEWICHERLQSLPCRHIEIDEIWGFIGKKRKNLKLGDEFTPLGDVWTFIAMDRDSKVIPAWHVGIRSIGDAQTFIHRLCGRLSDRVQLSSDQLRAYSDSVREGFNGAVDYGQVVKTYAVVNLDKSAKGRYSPAEVVTVEKTVMHGQPDPAMICTSHIEKQNHTLRMQ